MATARPDSARNTRSSRAPTAPRLPGDLLERPDLDGALAGLGGLRREGERHVEVRGLDDPDSTELLLRLGERAVGDDDLAAARPDHRRRRRRWRPPAKTHWPSRCSSSLNVSTWRYIRSICVASGADWPSTTCTASKYCVIVLTSLDHPAPYRAFRWTTNETAPDRHAHDDSRSGRIAPGGFQSPAASTRGAGATLGGSLALRVALRSLTVGDACVEHGGGGSETVGAARTMPIASELDGVPRARADRAARRRVGRSNRRHRVAMSEPRPGGTIRRARIDEHPRLRSLEPRGRSPLRLRRHRTVPLRPRR